MHRTCSVLTERCGKGTAVFMAPTVIYVRYVTASVVIHRLL